MRRTHRIEVIKAVAVLESHMTHLRDAVVEKDIKALVEEVIAERDEQWRKKMGGIADRQRAFIDSPTGALFDEIVRQTVRDYSTIIKSAIEEMRKQ
jgi:hypothetical protein